MEERIVQLNKFQKSIWETVKACREDGISNQGGYLSFNESIDIDNLMESIYIAISCESVLRMRINENDDFYISEYEQYEEGSILNISFESEEEFLEDMKCKMKQNLILPGEPLIKVWVAECGEQVFLCGVFHSLVTDGYGVARILSEAMNIYDMDRIDKDLYIIEKRSLSDSYFNQEFPNEDRINNLCAKDTFCNKADRLAADKAWIMKKTATKKDADELVWEISGDLYESIKDYEKDYQVFADAMFSAAIVVFINQATGSRYSVIEKTQLNRNKSQLELSGMFANSLPQVISVDEDKTFSELCTNIALENFKLMKLASCSKSELLEYCDGWEGQITDISLSYNNQKFAPTLRHGIRNDVFCGFLDIPLKINVYEKEESFLIQMQYQTEAYSKYEIEQYSQVIEYILRQACRQDFAIHEFMLGRSHNLSISKGVFEEREEYLMTVIEAFIEQVERNPYETAFIYEEEGQTKKMDYKIAGDCVCAISSYLKRCGVKRGDIVGIHMRRGVLMPLSILGAFLAEAAILPISIYENETECKKLREKCALVLDETFCKEEGGTILEARGQLSTVEEQELYHNPRDIAFYIRASKTTGEPKLVQISNYSLSVRLNWHRKVFGNEGVFMQKAKNASVVSVWELLYPGFSGATLYILPEGKELDMDYIADSIEMLGVTHIHFMPSALEQFIESNKWDKLCSLKYLISSGGVLKQESVLAFRENSPNVRVYNLYGMAECTIDVTGCECTGEEENVPLGTPVDRTTITIRNKNNKLVPKGYRGEIVISGDLVGEGYYQCESGEDGYFTENGKNHYRTGDIGWLDENGVLYYVGRKEVKKPKADIVNDSSEPEEYRNVEDLHEKEKTLYVKREGAKELLIAIPYAGGKTESMTALINSKSDTDILVPDLEAIDNGDTGNVKDMYKYLYDVICENVEKERQVVTVLGCCVGSVFAIGLYEYLQHMDVTVGDLIFCGSLPVSYFDKKGEIATIWDYAPDNMLGTALKLLGLEKNISKERAELFKKEVRIAAKLLKDRRKKVFVPRECKLILVYGCKDKLTLGWHKKYKYWSQYVSGKVNVKCVEDCGHYDLINGYLKML